MKLSVELLFMFIYYCISSLVKYLFKSFPIILEMQIDYGGNPIWQSSKLSTDPRGSKRESTDLLRSFLWLPSQGGRGIESRGEARFWMCVGRQEARKRESPEACQCSLTLISTIGRTPSTSTLLGRSVVSAGI